MSRIEKPTTGETDPVEQPSPGKIPEPLTWSDRLVLRIFNVEKNQEQKARRIKWIVLVVVLITVILLCRACVNEFVSGFGLV